MTTTDNTPEILEPETSPLLRATRLLLYIAVPAIILIVFEKHFREHIWSKTFGYQTTMQSTSHNIDHIFIGSSRTIAALDEGMFDRILWEQTGKDSFTINMAGGGNKLTHHYFGIRRLYEEDPYRMRNTTLFVETPDELPDYMPWSDPWVYSDHKHILLPNMHLGDLAPLWETNTPLNTKIHITINFLLYDWRTFERRYIIRNEVLRLSTLWVESRITSITGREKPIEEGIDNVTTRGGITANPDIVRRNEFFFNQFYEQHREELERPWRDWDNTVLRSIVDMVQEQGGRVVFFHVPQYSIYRRIYYDIPARDEDRQAIREFRERLGIPYLDPEFQTTDESFPDRFHLGIPQSEAYTKAFAKKYLEQIGR